MARKPADPHRVLEVWLERDLTAAAAAGELPPAFEADATLGQIADVLAAGRCPVLTGEPGIGKTAAVLELVRRAQAGSGPVELRGKRVLQFSLGRRASALRDPREVGGELQKLVEALLEIGGDVVPYIDDLHRAWDLDLEDQLQTLAYRFPNPILGEGDRAVLDTLFEYHPELEARFVTVFLEEPSLEQTGRIAAAWNRTQEAAGRRAFAEDALEEAVDLTHRFLARSRMPRKVLDLLGQVQSLTDGSGPIGAEAVMARFCDTYRVPRFLVDPAIRLDLDEVEKRFAGELLGQREAVRAVVEMIGLIKAGLSDLRRPFGVFFFVGPTGVGKTHLAQLLAEYLFGSRSCMVRFNMADYAAPGSERLLFGQSEANRLADQRGLLTRSLMGRPFAVLLLDELEKAHAAVHDRFLQLVDEGCFGNGAGETISARATILIATSNAGAEVFRAQAIGFAGESDVSALERELDRRLDKAFRFEFLNRFDRIVHFRPLTRDDVRTIARRELERLRGSAGLKRRKLSLEVDESVLDWLTAHGYDPHYGARFLRRAIERHVTTALADTIVRTCPPASSRLSLSVAGNRVVARVVVRERGRARTEDVLLPLGPGERLVRLDRDSLGRETAAVLAAAGRRLEELEGKRKEAGELLVRMNGPGFRETPEESRVVLKRYRELDVAIQVGERLAAPIRRLAELAGSAIGREELPRLARALEEAAHALRSWEDRVAEETTSGAWLVVSSFDALEPAGSWIEELVRMELAWCERLYLSATVVAFELAGEHLNRVALEVEGPGAGAYLAMEEGIHRLHRDPAADLRARVELVAKSEEPPAADRTMVSAVRRRKGRLGVEVTCRARVALPEQGLVAELCGPGVEVVAHLAGDLRAAWSGRRPEAPETARVYCEGGVGARDPRTGAVVARLRDVMKGTLDGFLEGWRKRDGGTAS